MGSSMFIEGSVHAQLMGSRGGKARTPKFRFTRADIVLARKLRDEQGLTYLKLAERFNASPSGTRAAMLRSLSTYPDTLN